MKIYSPSKSKNKIIHTLLNLLESSTFEEITVQEIADHANLSRQTFYRHFDTKEKVLATLFETLYEECFSLITDKNDSTLEEILFIFFDYWYKQKALITLLNDDITIDVIQYYFKHSSAIFSYFLPFFSEKKLSTNEIYYLENKLIGDLFNFKYAWFRRNFAETPEELTKIYLDLTFFIKAI